MNREDNHGTRPRRPHAAACGAASAMVGLGVLSGWLFQIPALKTVLPGFVSMKPNTALAFVLAGAALAARSTPSTSARRTRAGHLLAAAVVLIGSLTLCEIVFGWDLGIDQFLFLDDPGAAATSRPGRMAPSTAASLVLLGLALLGIDWTPRRGVRPADVLVTAVLAVGLVSIAEYAVGGPILYGFGQYTRMALLTAAVFLVLAVGAALARPDEGWLGAVLTGAVEPGELRVSLSLGVGLLLVLAAGGWFYGSQEQQVRRDVEADLKAIAEMKVAQIRQWRRERAGDAGVLVGSALLADTVARWLDDPRPELGEAILGTFRAFEEHGEYDEVLLVDRRNQVRLSLHGRARALDEDTVRAVAAAVTTRRPVLSDLRASDGESSPHIDAIAPLLAGQATAAPPIAAVVLRQDAARFLYPLIQSWPRPSRSAETLLVERDGDSALYLNELRHRRNTALKLRNPLSQATLPAAAVALGRRGLMEGVDYRGVAVLAALNAVPDSPWLMVTKVDEDEAFDEWRLRAGLIVAVVVALSAALVVALLMVRQRGVSYQALAGSAESLRASEERLRLMVEHVQDYAIYLLDPDGRVASWNAGAERIKGYRAEEILGQPVSCFYTPEDVERGRPERALAMAIAEGRFEEEAWRVRKDGSLFWANAVVTGLRDGSGRLRGFAKVTRDITERKRTDAELERYQDHLEELVASRTAEILFGRARLAEAQAMAHLGSWEWDIVSDVISGSDEFYRLFDVPPERLRTIQMFADLLHADDVERVRRDVQKTLADNVPFDTGYRVPVQGGNARHIHARGRVITDDSGRPVRMTGTCLDVTERARLEAKRERLVSELARSNRELEQFAYVASHDLQEPLRMVASYTALLEADYKGKLGPDADLYIHYAVDGARRMQRLIADLLALSRVGTQGKPFRPVDTRAACARALENIDLAVRQAGAEVEVSDLPTVPGDPGQIVQVFQNLLSNAVKFRGAATPSVRVEARRDGDAWLFQVRDNGIGFDPAQAERIFQMFQRLHGRAEYEGSGIGLAIVRKIVQRHGGGAWAESAPGMGSCFFFTLPATARHVGVGDGTRD